jgi:UDP-glucose 4-epimerase
VPVLIGRIANLYGPGQDLAKPQGLISQLCWSHMTQRPLNIYVPLGTMRDYLFAPDCGEMIASCTMALPAGGGVSLKVLASERPMSVGAVLGEFRRAIRRPTRTSLRASPVGSRQVFDLRLHSSSPLGSRGAVALTPFPVGLRTTFEDLRLRRALGGGSAHSVT